MYVYAYMYARARTIHFPVVFQYALYKCLKVVKCQAFLIGKQKCYILQLPVAFVRFILKNLVIIFLISDYDLTLT